MRDRTGELVDDDVADLHNPNPSAWKDFPRLRGLITRLLQSSGKGLRPMGKFPIAKNASLQTGSWLGTDLDGRPIPCLTCRPHLTKTLKGAR